MSRASELLNMIEAYSEPEELDERASKRVVRYRAQGQKPGTVGKRQIKRTCGPGYRLTGGRRCVRMTAQERRKRSRSQRFAQRRLKSKRRQINRRRQRTMQRRKRAGF